MLRTRPHATWLLSRIPLFLAVSAGNGVIATIVACGTAAVFGDSGPGDGFNTGIRLGTLVTWLLAVPSVYLIVLFSVWRTTHYVITDRRVFTVEGMRRKRPGIPLTQVTKVSHIQRPLDTLFGSGDLIVESAGAGRPLRLHRLPRIEEAKAELLSLLP